MWQLPARSRSMRHVSSTDVRDTEYSAANSNASRCLMKGGRKHISTGFVYGVRFVTINIAAWHRD